MSDYGIQICSLFYIIILIIIFFSKKRINSLENKIFKFIIILNFLGQILEIGCIYFVKYLDKFFVLRLIFTKGYLVYLISWIFLFTLYIFIITYKNSNKFNFNHYLLILLIPYFLCSIATVFLPMSYHNENGEIYSYGFAPKFAYIVSFTFF